MEFSIKEMNRMFYDGPGTQNEVIYKSNVSKVAFDVGYSNANEGKDDRSVVKVADRMFAGGLYYFEVEEANINGRKNVLEEKIRHMEELFDMDYVDLNEDFSHARLYKLFRESVKRAYEIM